MTVEEARLDLAGRHGFSSWEALRGHVAALREGRRPPGPFMLAFRAVEAGDRAALVGLLDRHRSSPGLAARTATTCWGSPAPATTSTSSGCCCNAAPTRTAATPTAGRRSTRRATGIGVTSPS
jgi:hypothetical protein